MVVTFLIGAPIEEEKDRAEPKSVINTLGRDEELFARRMFSGFMSNEIDQLNQYIPCCAWWVVRAELTYLDERFPWNACTAEPNGMVMRVCSVDFPVIKWSCRRTRDAPGVPAAADKLGT